MLRAESINRSLPALPLQPPQTPWPTRRWATALPEVADNDQLQRTCDEIMTLSPAQGVTYGLQVVHRGQLVVDRYAAGASPFYLQYSWSMAKSVTQALVGILVKQGRLDIYAPADVPEWRDDARREITVDELLRMSSGLEFNEDYVDGAASDVIPMLQLGGRHDVGVYAAAKPLLHPPGTHWSYSSGTTNIICRILKGVVGGGASGMLRFMNDELFEPLGIRSATPKFDTSGTFIGSSFLMATPQDFARFGLLYLRGGIWDGQQILPSGWVDYARSPTYNDGVEAYGAQWWMKPDKPDWFYSSGYDGQRILCVPEKDLIIVRCGRTPISEIDYVWERVFGIAELFADT
jgi:CubicO group peptidase (beta-lactamase class C family)